MHPQARAHVGPRKHYRDSEQHPLHADLVRTRDPIMRASAHNVRQEPWRAPGVRLMQRGGGAVRAREHAHSLLLSTLSLRKTPQWAAAAAYCYTSAQGCGGVAQLVCTDLRLDIVV